MDVHGASDVLELGEVDTADSSVHAVEMIIWFEKRDLRGKVAAEIKRAFDVGKVLEPVNGCQLGVVGDLVSSVGAVDGGQQGHGDVGELRVVDKDDTASEGQIGGHKGLDGVLVEAEILGDVGKAGKVDLARIAESHLICGLEIREIDGLASTLHFVGTNIDGTLHGRHVQGDLSQEAVVADTETIDLGDLAYTFETGQVGVGDEDGSCLSKTRGSKIQSRQCRQTREVEVVTLTQCGHGKSGESGQISELEIANRLKLSGPKVLHLAVILIAQSSCDDLDTIEADSVEVASSPSLDSNASTECCASCECRRTCRIGNRGGS